MAITTTGGGTLSGFTYIPPPTPLKVVDFKLWAGGGGGTAAGDGYGGGSGGFVAGTLAFNPGTVL